MKKTLLIVASAACLCLCAGCADREQKVMARYVPERADDFVWENERIAYRAYGKALEDETLSPGFDVWVKDSCRLCANEWYEMAANKTGSYHNYHRGKDCYKVAESLGAGASSPVVDGEFVFPATNYRTWKIIEETPSKVVFSIGYPEWDVAGHKVALTKTITVTPDTWFCKCEDSYTGDFDSLTVAAGLLRHSIYSAAKGIVRSQVIEACAGNGAVALWEEASDQTQEPEDGLIGTAVYMPEADYVTEGLDVCDEVKANTAANHALAVKKIAAGEKVEYWFGSCWSRGEVQTFDQWLDELKKLEASVR